MNKKINRTQALLTAVGFMVGSGIFFKADNIIISTKGNVFISILSWIFISTSLIFAGISVSALASQEEISGGFIGYIEHYFSKFFGDKTGKFLSFIIGWYQIVVYIPIMLAIVSITFSAYLLQLLDYQDVGSIKYILASILLMSMFIWNGISTKIGALVSTSATIIKLIPLFIIGVAGALFGDPSNITTTPIINDSVTNTSTLALFFAPMLSMAFAFDGWISVGSLSKDMKNSKTDLPIVFTWSVIITAAIYIFYFVGVTLLMPAGDIIQNADSHVGIIASNIGGYLFARFILFGVLISCLGTANAVFMAGSRYTHKLAQSNFLLASDFFKKDSKNNTPFNASIFVFISSFIFIILYFLQAKFNYNSIIIDDIPMALNSFFYLFIFFITFKLYFQKKVHFFKGFISPLFGALGQAFIVIAFFLTNDAAMFYTFISLIVILLGFINLLSKNNELKNLLKK